MTQIKLERGEQQEGKESKERKDTKGNVKKT
jgi:hypothetical protein